MRHPAVTVLLMLGAVGGFASGFASLGRHHMDRKEAFEAHIAQVCVEASRTAERARASQSTAPVVAPTIAPAAL